jgi:cyclopropane fatty-acyl-phospholipid synthase-like methyltransferase
MSDASREAHWERRYAATDDYVFGVLPNAFLAAEADRIAPGARVLAVADGEGRNGVFLAERGAAVHSVEASAAAIAKAKRLAARRGVTPTFEQADLIRWEWPVAAYDAVVAIFVQFVTAAERPAFFAHLKRALRPGGLLLLEGYRVEQPAYGTGGPREATQLYTEALIREAFADMSIEALRSYDAVIEEGTGHAGMSALIDLVAVQPG